MGPWKLQPRDQEWPSKVILLKVLTHFGTFFLLLLLLLICKWLLIRALPVENGILVPCLPLPHDVLCPLKPQPKTNVSSLMLLVSDILSQR